MDCRQDQPKTIIPEVGRMQVTHVWSGHVIEEMATDGDQLVTSILNYNLIPSRDDGWILSFTFQHDHDHHVNV